MPAKLFARPLFAVVFTGLVFVPAAIRAFQQNPQVPPRAAAPRSAATPQQLAILNASEKDRQRMMDMLHITALRLGPQSRSEPQPGRLGLEPGHQATPVSLQQGVDLEELAVIGLECEVPNDLGIIPRQVDQEARRQGAAVVVAAEEEDIVLAEPALERGESLAWR